MSSLLDDLSRHLKKAYVSDLKRLNEYDRAEAAKFISSKKATDYSIFAWNDAHTYITGHNHKDVFPEEAKLKLIECLKK